MTMPENLAVIKFSGDPLINVAGAYFPAWLACMILGIIGTWVIALLLPRLKLSAVMHPRGLMIPAIFAAITLWIWMFYFAAR